MALLERVAALVRANLNDLIDKAEDPEKMIKQVVLDMQNQLLQVKTQVAIAIADQHLLARKAKENEERQADWMRKAEIAVERKDDDLARGALERSMSYRELAEGFHEQVADQKAEVDSLKTALSKLDQKLSETRSKTEMLLFGGRASRPDAGQGRPGGSLERGLRRDLGRDDRGPFRRDRKREPDRGAARGAQVPQAAAGLSREDAPGPPLTPCPSPQPSPAGRGRLTCELPLV